MNDDHRISVYRKGVGKIDSRENLARIVEQYQNLVFSICLKITGDYFASEDITQETFIAAYRHWDDFDGSSEKAWICRIASNKCIDWRRSSAVRKNISMEETRLPEPEYDSREDPLELFLADSVLNTVSESCRELPEPYRSAAELYFIKGMTARQIAEKNNENVKTVQTRIRRAREMLRKKIRKEDLLT